MAQTQHRVRVQESSSGIRAGADTFGYIAVFPTGFDDVESQQMSGSTSWNGVGTVASPGMFLGEPCEKRGFILAENLVLNLII